MSGTTTSSDASNQSNQTNQLNQLNQIDYESKCGRFGWETIDGTYIPYIYRSTDKYCAIRIADTKLLHNYLHKMHFKLFNNVQIAAYQLTNSEIVLLNEINTMHCDRNYGNPFTKEDYIIRLEDLKTFYEYLTICYYKLNTKSVDMRDRCGFLRINKQQVVSFINKENAIEIPVFYFENETLFHTGVYASGWDVQYLNFCFAVQGLHKSNQTTIEVITLDGVKSRLPPGSCFEPFWPDLNTTALLVNNKVSDDILHNMWTSQVNNIVTKTTPIKINNSTNFIEFGKPLQQISEPQLNTTKQTKAPYHIAMLQVGHTFVPCINKNAHDTSDYLITLPDLVHFFLKNVSLMKCKEYLDYLNIELYRGNWLQMRQLCAAKKCQSIYDYLPLMNLRDVRSHLSQIRLLLLSQ